MVVLPPPPPQVLKVETVEPEVTDGKISHKYMWHLTWRLKAETAQSSDAEKVIYGKRLHNLVLQVSGFWALPLTANYSPDYSPVNSWCASEPSRAWFRGSSVSSLFPRPFVCSEIGPAPQREEAPHLLSRNVARVCRNSSSVQDSIHVISLSYNEQYLTKIHEGHLSMWASAADYVLNDFLNPKRQLIF
jgi:hypothetical protein